MARKSVIAVVGSGNEIEPAVANAREIGRMIAEHGWVLITGGRNAGVMRAANEGAKQIDESLTVGILPDKVTEISPAVDVAIVTGVGEARNNIVVLSADVVMACGVDDPGTASEVSLAIKAGKPVIVVSVSAATRAFLAEIGGSCIRFVDTPAEAIEIAREIMSFHK
jgi:uncharacterized protein (TIGR00725 family)